MSDLNDVFGEAKFGGTKTNWFKFPKEGGSLVLRILPPYGSLRKTGRWNQYYAIHFGYRDTKGNLRPFQSCEVTDQNRMVVTADPATERIKKIKVAQDKAKVENNTEMVKKLGEQLQIFNVKKAYYMNVMDLQGKIGIFSISYKMKQALDEEIKRLQAKGVNPLSAADGRFFVFTRTGFGATTSFKVSVYAEEVTMNGMQVSVEKKHALTADVADRIQTEGADLGGLYISPTPEEIASIVSGDAKTLEAVFAKHRGNGGGSDHTGEEDEEIVSTSSSPARGQSAAPAVAAAAVVNTPVAPEAEPAPVAANADFTQMSNDDFLKSMGL